MSDVNLSSLGKKFEHALAQSVFTHLPLNTIIRCIMNIDKVLIKGGRFYATLFKHPEGKKNLEPVMHQSASVSQFATYLDEDPYHYDFETFRWIVQGTSLRGEQIGDWGHPKDQKMMFFEKR